MWLRLAAKYLAGLLLACVLIWWVLRGTDPATLWAQLKQVSVLGLILAAGINFAHNAFRVWRWGALLAPVSPRLRFRPMFDAVILGYFVTWTVPGRLGEVVRPVLLSARQKVPLGACFGSVLADRVLDGLAVLVLFAVGLAFTSIEGLAARHPAVGRGSVIAIIVLLVPMVLLLVASSQRTRLEGWLGARRGPLAWLSRSLLAFAQGTEALRQPRLLARVAVHTLLAWLTIAIGTWVGLRACRVEISLGAVFILLPLLALGVAVPTPGGAGGYHAAMKFGLVHLFDVSPALAVSAGILLHLAILVPVLAVGAVLLLVERLSLQELIEAARQVRKLGS